jgi:tRNA-binding EMAP/Myf-like protein
MKNKIGFPTFLEIEGQLEITIGKIINVESVPKSDKMLKLTVSFGEELGTRIVMTNIGNKIPSLKVLMDRYFCFITNLEPAKIMGEISEAMIMVPMLSDGSFDLLHREGSKLL